MCALYRTKIIFINVIKSICIAFQTEARKSSTSTNVALQVSEMEARVIKKIDNVVSEVENVSDDIMSLRSSSLKRINDCLEKISDVQKSLGSRKDVMSSSMENCDQTVFDREEVRLLREDVSELRKMVTRNLELVDRIFTQQCRGRPLITSQEPSKLVNRKSRYCSNYFSFFVGSIFLAVIIAFIIQLYKGYQ